MTLLGLRRLRWGYGSGWPGGGRTKKNVTVNGLPGWICAPTYQPDAVRWSAGRQNAGLDGHDQAIQWKEKAFDTAYTLTPDVTQDGFAALELTDVNKEHVRELGGTDNIAEIQRVGETYAHRNVNV